MAVDAARLLEQFAALRDLARVAAEGREVSQRRGRRANASRDELLEGVERYAAPTVRRAENRVDSAVNQPLTALNVAYVGFEILDFVANSRIVEDLLVVRIVRIERAVERQALARAVGEHPDHAVRQTVRVAGDASAPALTRQLVRRNDRAESWKIDGGGAEEDSLPIMHGRFQRARLRQCGCAHGRDHLIAAEVDHRNVARELVHHEAARVGRIDRHPARVLPDEDADNGAGIARLLRRVDRRRAVLVERDFCHEVRSRQDHVAFVAVVSEGYLPGHAEEEFLFARRLEVDPAIHVDRLGLAVRLAFGVGRDVYHRQKCLDVDIEAHWTVGRSGVVGQVGAAAFDDHAVERVREGAGYEGAVRRVRDAGRVRGALDLAGERRAFRPETGIGKWVERDRFDHAVACRRDDGHTAFLVIVRADDRVRAVNGEELRDVDLLVVVVAIAVAGDGDSARLIADAGNRFDNAIGRRVDYRDVVRARVGHVEFTAVGRERQAVGLCAGGDRGDGRARGGVDDRDRAADGVGDVNSLSVRRDGQIVRFIADLDLRDFLIGVVLDIDY